jgi:hypothetical protein
MISENGRVDREEKKKEDEKMKRESKTIKICDWLKSGHNTKKKEVIIKIGSF